MSGRALLDANPAAKPWADKAFSLASAALRRKKPDERNMAALRHELGELQRQAAERGCEEFLAVTARVLQWLDEFDAWIARV